MCSTEKRSNGFRTQDTWIIWEKVSLRYWAGQGLKTEEHSPKQKQAVPSSEHMADSIIKLECYLHSPKQTEKNPLVCNQGHSESYVWNGQRLTSISDDSWLPEKEPIYLIQVKGNNSLPATSSGKDPQHDVYASLINNLDLLYLAKWANLGSEFCPNQQIRIITLSSSSSCFQGRSWWNLVHTEDKAEVQHEEK